MIEYPNAQWDGGLESLFAVLDETCRRGTPPRRLDRTETPGRAVSFPVAPPGGEMPCQPELFAAPAAPPVRAVNREERDGGPAAPECVPPPFPGLRRCPSAVLLHELSADAFDALVHAWMSELPLGAAMIRFAWSVIAAARYAAAGEEARRGGAPVPGWAALPEARLGAERAAANRCDPDVRAVLEAAYKVRRETDRLMGLLRFSPCPRNGAFGGKAPGGGSGGGPGASVYIARCSPDHHILPGLVEYFTRRFGEYPWAVIDEKRNLVLAGEPGGEARLFSLCPPGPGETLLPGASPGSDKAADGPDPRNDNSGDYIEELWRNYHRSINNPDRNNPALQQQFIPRRYRKYLPEFR